MVGQQSAELTQWKSSKIEEETRPVDVTVAWMSSTASKAAVQSFINVTYPTQTAASFLPPKPSGGKWKAGKPPYVSFGADGAATGGLISFGNRALTS